MVNSRTIDAGAANYNATFGQGNVWAEQTYGVTGAAMATGFLSTPGSLYGGRNAAVSDNAAGAITTAEHVTKVSLAGGNVTGVDSGFSFNAIVNTRGDTGDDDTSNARMQQGSLRQFILNANALIGTQISNFSIGGGGPQTIALTAALPTITQSAVLDATSQEFFAGTPLIELNGAGAGASATGLTIGAGSSLVRGFVINRFGQDGIAVIAGSDSTIAGNWIGTDTPEPPTRGMAATASASQRQATRSAD